MIYLLEHLEEDIQHAWDDDQKQIILRGLRTGDYCRSVPVDQLQGKGMGSHSTNCVYLWRRKSDLKGYVGIVSTSTGKRTRKARDNEHLSKNSSKSPFDLELRKNPSDWEVITLCSYGVPPTSKHASNWEREGR